MPGTALLDLSHAVGSVSGRDLDKFAAHELRPLIGPVLGMPLIEDGCSAWLECRLYAEPHTEDAYDTCFAEVVAAAADPRIFSNGRWHYDADNAHLQSIHHLGGGNFAVSAGMRRARDA